LSSVAAVLHKRPGDLDLSPFDLGTPAECQSCHGQPSSQFWSFCDFVVELWANVHQTDDLTLLRWPLTVDVTAHVGDAGHCTVFVYLVSNS